MEADLSQLGKKFWVIPEGYIPEGSLEKGRAFESHETACILNTTGTPAHVEIYIYFSDRDPVGPYHVEVLSRRTKHVRFNDLKDPQPVPRGTDYASVIFSDVPIIVQHTRLDSRKEALALLSTIAYSSSIN